MLTTLRGKAAGWVAKGFIVLLGVSFAAWGVSDIFTGRRNDVLVTVGDHDITSELFSGVLNRRLKILSEQTGQALTLEQARQFGIDRQILGELVQGAALDEQGDRLRLAIPDSEIARRIVASPSFHNAQGVFDRDRFEHLLAANGLSEADFVRSERMRLIRVSLASPIDQHLEAPETLIKAVYDHDHQTRSGQYFVLPDSLAGPLPAPSDADVQSWYDLHKGAYTMPQFRNLTLLSLRPDDLIDTIEISDHNLKQAYDTRKSQFSTPEKRQVLYLSFQTEQDAVAARKRLVSGASFADMAKARGVSRADYDLGWVTRDDIADEVLGATVFSLAKGQISEPVKGTLSIALVKVEDIKPALVQPLTQVRDELLGELKRERVRDEILDLRDRIEDRRADGSTLAEIARDLDLRLMTVDAIDGSGSGPDGHPVASIPARAKVTEVAFASDIGVENDPVETPDGGFVWVDVVGVTPQTLKPLDQVRDEVMRQWRDEQKREALKKMADQFVKDGADGADFVSLAHAAGAEIKQTGPITRTGMIEGLGASAVNALFSSALDHVTSAYDDSSGTYVLVEPTKADEPVFSRDSDGVKDIAQRLAAGMGNDLFGHYQKDLQTRIGVSLNSRLWRRLNDRTS
ncbi:MAG: SurA N-terminal domain-containing protein [Hyphomicrobiales bacterium]